MDRMKKPALHFPSDRQRKFACFANSKECSCVLWLDARRAKGECSLLPRLVSSRQHVLNISQLLLESIMFSIQLL